MRETVEDSSGYSDTEPRDGVLRGTDSGQTVENSSGETAEDSSGHIDPEQTGA